MIKTFTLNAIDHEQETPESGSITWYVVDEHNRKRAIKAITELSRQGFIKTVKPFNDREMPLVELLSYYVEGESFRIDFSIFKHKVALFSVSSLASFSMILCILALWSLATSSTRVSSSSVSGSS